MFRRLRLAENLLFLALWWIALPDHSISTLLSRSYTQWADSKSAVLLNGKYVEKKVNRSILDIGLRTNHPPSNTYRRNNLTNH